MKPEELLQLTEYGLYCPAGDFFIDPHRAVDRAVITHAHADHACAGHRLYLAHPVTLALIRQRLARVVTGLEIPYGESLLRDNVRVTLHPAGHVPGSAQVRIEYRGYTAVVTGDYKLERDGVSEPYEQQQCHLFVSESTFGLPVFRWRPQQEIIQEIVDWYRSNRERGVTTILVAYALGKAQRLLALLAPHVEGIIVHRTVAGVNAALRASRVALPAFQKLNASLLEAGGAQGGLIIASTQGLREEWPREVAPFAVGVVSGWMALRHLRKKRGADKGFVLSDHADWPALNAAASASQADDVLFTHGYSAVIARWLRERGMRAGELDLLGASPQDSLTYPGADAITEED